jgi:hypothetical protein
MPCSRGRSAHRRRSENTRLPCQVGGRGFESRRPLQRNRRSRWVRTGPSSWWGPKNVPGAPSRPVAYTTSSCIRTLRALRRGRPSALTGRRCNSSYSRLTIRIAQRRTSCSEVGRPPPPSMDVEHCRRIVCRTGSLCPGGGSSPSSTSGADRLGSARWDYEVQFRLLDCVPVGSPRVRTPDADERRSAGV